MANDSLPDWIGRHVGVRFVPEGMGEKKITSGSCILEGVDERGIMVSFDEVRLGEDDALEHSQRLWFIPWHRIEGIVLLPT